MNSSRPVSTNNDLEAGAPEGTTIDCVEPTGPATNCTLGLPPVRGVANGNWECVDIESDSYEVILKGNHLVSKLNITKPQQQV